MENRNKLQKSQTTIPQIIRNNLNGNFFINKTAKPSIKSAKPQKTAKRHISSRTNTSNNNGKPKSKRTHTNRNNNISKNMITYNMPQYDTSFEEYLETQRQRIQDFKNGNLDSVKVYHITSKDNIKDILKDGLLISKVGTGINYNDNNNNNEKGNLKKLIYLTINPPLLTFKSLLSDIIFNSSNNKTKKIIIKKLNGKQKGKYTTLSNSVLELHPNNPKVLEITLDSKYKDNINFTNEHEFISQTMFDNGKGLTCNKNIKPEHIKIISNIQSFNKKKTKNIYYRNLNEYISILV